MSVSQKNTLPFLPVLAALGLALAPSGGAQDPDDSPAGKTPATVADYSKGFALFYKLGLPDASKATYVRLQSRFDYPDPMTGGNSAFSRISATGNAWLLSEKNGVGRLVVGNARVVSLKKSGSEGQHQPPADTDEEPSVDIVGRWEPADLSGDVNKVIKFLGDQKSSSSEDVNEWSGGLLLFAAHLSNHGFLKEANQIAAALFQISGSKDAVIDSAVNCLACRQYHDALDGLFSSKNNWAGFESDVTALVSKYGSSWEWEPAARKIIQQAKMRTSAPRVPNGLSEGERRLATELANAPLYRNADIRMWGLKPPTGGKHPIDRIRALGMKAIPLLVTLLTDDYPVLFDYRLIRYSSGFSERYGSRHKMFSETSERPATRGEVAAFLLSEILPKPENDGVRPISPSMDKLADSARAWYSQHKDNSPAELAMAYLAEGDANQKQVAAEFLIDGKSEGSMQAIENYLLANVGYGFNMDILTKLARIQGKDANAFLEKYANAIGALSSRSLGEEQKKRMLQAIENIKEAASGKTAREFMEEISSGKRKWEDSEALFFESLQNEETDAALGLLLELVIGSKDNELKSQVLCGITLSCSELLAKNPPKPPGPMDPRTHSSLWKQLLDDKSPIDGCQIQGQLFPPTVTYGQLAALAIEGVYGDAFSDNRRDDQQLLFLGRKPFEILHARSLARIDGRPVADLPPLPSAKNVSVEQKKVILDQLSSAQDQDIPDLLSRLTSDEILSLSQNSTDSPPAKVIQALNRITRISADGLSPDKVTQFGEWKGKPISREMFEQVRSCTRELAKSGKAATATFYREAGGGIELMISVRPGNEQSKTMPEGIVLGLVASPGGSAQNLWPLNDDDQSPYSQIGNQTNFDAKLNAFINGGFSSFAAGKIILLGTPEPRPPDSTPNSENE